MRSSHLLFALTTLVLLASCSGSQTIDTSSTLVPSTVKRSPVAPPDLRTLPSLPIGRASSGLLETSRDGNNTFSRSASAIENAPELNISSTSSTIGWGIWELSSSDELRYLDLQLTVPQGQQAYLALADYSAMRWALQGPVVSGRVLTLDPIANASPGGKVYAAVIVTGGDSATVQKLSLIAFHANAAPTAQLQADLTTGAAPLSVSFDASASTDPDPGDSIVRYYWDFDGDGLAEEVGFNPIAVHVFKEPGVFDAAVTVEDRDGERNSAAVQITVSAGNVAPSAGLSILPNDVGQGTQVVLDASVSTDIDGDIVNYEWDIDGDGTYDANTPANTLTFNTQKAGRFAIRVRVTDSAGATAVATALLRVHGFNAAHDFSDPLADGGIGPSMTLVNGLPAIAFFDGPNIQLKYVRALDSSGSNWTTPLAVNLPGEDGGYPSLTVINGKPAIAYYIDATDSLMYVQSTDSLGNGWTAPLNLTGTDDAGIYPSLREVNGRPAVSFLKFDTQDLGYVRASDPDGAAWGLPQYLDTANTSGYYTSMQVLAGNPAIAYYDIAGTDLRIILSLDSDGDNWGAVQNIDAGAGDTGANCSLAIVRGYPCVAYRKGNGVNAVWFNRANGIDGSSWGVPQQIDNTGADTGGFISLCEVEGDPAVAYYDATNKDLRYLKALDAGGNSWPIFPAIVDSQNDTGRYCSMLQFEGGPAMAYFDDTLMDIKYSHGF